MPDHSVVGHVAAAELPAPDGDTRSRDERAPGELLIRILYVQEVVTSFYIVSYYIKWVTTSWAYSTIYLVC